MSSSNGTNGSLSNGSGNKPPSLGTKPVKRDALGGGGGTPNRPPSNPKK